MSTETPTLARYRISGPTMGSRFTAVFEGPPGLAVEPLRAALQQAVDRVDRQMSSWNPDSDLMRLNAAPLNDWVSLPEELVWVLASALRISRESGGAFEIAVGALVGAWGFGPGPAQAFKPGAPASACMALELDPEGCRARKHQPLTLDLNGIAKGFGVDELARCLAAFDLPCHLVGIDGEMRAGLARADGREWAVALEAPLRGRREARGLLELAEVSVATSGDYRHWLDGPGGTYAHTMDPRRGAPLDNGLASVTVLTTSCMYADAWATALMVSGVESGCRVARQQGLQAIFLQREGAALREVTVGL
jgi:thiamine biosynthesis lipoprotein